MQAFQGVLAAVQSSYSVENPLLLLLKKELHSRRFLQKQSSFLRKRLWHRCFPMNFAKFLRTPFLTEHLRWLLYISGVLKTDKSECCSLQVCKFLMRNPIRDHFLKIFCKFQSTFNKFSWEFPFSSVANCIL